MVTFCWAAVPLLAEPSEGHVEPIYKGQPLSYWVWVLGGPSYSSMMPHDPTDIIEGGPEAKEALEHIGTNAIPFLLRWIGGEPAPLPAPGIFSQPDHVPPASRQQADHAPWGTSSVQSEGAMQAFRILGPAARPAIPELARLVAKDALLALPALVAIGPEAAPVLLTMATNKAYASFSRGGALGAAVSLMGTNAQALLPLLLQYAEEGDQWLAVPAVRALGAVGAGRPEALAVLERSLQDPRRYGWRSTTLDAVAALGDMGVPTLVRAFRSDDPGTRNLAEHELVDRLPQTLTNSAVLAAAADNLRSADEDRRLAASRLLRAADQQARGQKPDLYLPLRERDSLLDHATNILRRLAPQLLEKPLPGDTLRQ
jgi:hypothetical protein